MSAYGTSLLKYKLPKGKGIVSYPCVLFTITLTIGYSFSSLLINNSDYTPSETYQLRYLSVYLSNIMNRRILN